MVSHGYLPGLVFLPEQGIHRIPKGYQPILSNIESRPDVNRLGSLNMRLHSNCSLNGEHIAAIDPTIKGPLLIDVQETGSNSIRFSSAIAKQCIRRWEILKFLMSVSNDIERDGKVLPKLSELVGLQEMTSDMSQEPYDPEYGLCFHDAEYRPTLFYPNSDFYTQKPIMDFMGNLICGRVLLTSSGTEVNDIPSVIAKFYLSENKTKWEKKSLLVPYFDRLGYRARRSNTQGSSSTLQTVKFSPAKSSEKTALAKKKTNRKSGKENDIYRKNHLYAVECLLSIMVDKKRNGKATILALKKCGPELPQLLTQLSATIAGTGLALLFFLVFKVGSGTDPLSASKIVNTGFGIGMVWLSMAVHKLRDTITDIIKSFGKSGVKEEEEMMMKKLDRNVKEIYLRASMLMAVGIMRLS